MAGDAPKKKGLLSRIFKSPTELTERARKSFQGESEFSTAPQDAPQPGSPAWLKAERLKKQFQGDGEAKVVPPAPAKKK